MSEKKFADLDFATIKENLKTFLKGQQKFKDYDFEASGLSILLDVLSYNTAYNGFYLNMLASEMFLDSASQRNSVVSRAKHLGYLPSSPRSLAAVVDVEFDWARPGRRVVPEPTSGFLLKTNYEFYTTVDTTRYTYTPRYPVFVMPVGNKKYVAKNVHLIEGKRLKYRWTYDSTLPIKQRFVIPNPNADVTTLSVIVTDSATSTNKTVFSKFEDITTTSDKDPIYFIEESESGKYEIIFGDGIFGKKLVDGNVIDIEYVVPTNNETAGQTKFYINAESWENKIHVDVISKVVCTIPAKDYHEKESIEKIKFLAPKLYTIQNRAVTKNDYEILLKKGVASIDPKIQYLRVWGGEENDPPEYGKVFCAIKPEYGLALSTADKQRIIETYIKPRNMISVQVEVVEPDYMWLIVDSTVNYASDKTTNNKDTIKNLVVNKIKEFRDNTLLGFDSDFRHSKFVKFVDEADPSIESNTTSIKLKYQIQPLLSTFYSTTIKLNNPLDRGDAANNIKSITSSPFYYINRLVFIGDDASPNERKDGHGVLGLYPYGASKSAPIKTVGHVDYDTGDIILEQLVVDTIPNQKNYIDIYAKPKNNDVIMYKNQILLLEDSDINVSVLDLLTMKLS